MSNVIRMLMLSVLASIGTAHNQNIDGSHKPHPINKHQPKVNDTIKTPLRDEYA